MIDSNGTLNEISSVVRVLFQTKHPGFPCICGFVSTGVFSLFSVPNIVYQEAYSLVTTTWNSKQLCLSKDTCRRDLDYSRKRYTFRLQYGTNFYSTKKNFWVCKTSKLPILLPVLKLSIDVRIKRELLWCFCLSNSSNGFLFFVQLL